MEEPDPLLIDTFEEFSCRLCLFTNKSNIHIFSDTGVDEEIAQKVARYLCFEVREDDEYPNWICSVCRRALNSFHLFYLNAEETRTQMNNMLSTVKSRLYNVGESLKTDILNVEKPVNDALANNISSTIRSLKRRAAKLSRKKSENVSESSEVKEEVVMSEGPDFKEEMTTDFDTESSTENDLPVEEFNGDYDSNESDDDASWKPGSKTATRSKGRPRKEKLVNDDKDRKQRKVYERKENNEESVEILRNDLDIDEEERDPLSPLKRKLRITATHGTLPKPRMAPGSRKIVRAQMNAMMMQFYGITCDICVNKAGGNPASAEPTKYETFEDLCNHMQKDHNVRGYLKCCNCTMRERKRAERHMLLHTMPGSVYKCNICGKQLSSQQSFRCHILLHLPDSERPYRCAQCERGFVTKADLTQHEHQHLPDDKRFSYTCDVCGSRFSYESGLMIHKQRVHDNIRTHLCDICAKSFNSRCDMERHREQIHGNVKREQCPECGKWFKGPSILKTHMRQHRGVVYQCQFCEKKYSVRSSWKAHLLRHSDEKPHKCPMCDKTFKLPGTLKMHLNQHTGELPYACPFCPKKFASSGNYYTHRKRMHREEVAQMKEATEASLVASGLPPPTTVPPPTTTQKLSQAIARAKEVAKMVQANNTVQSSTSSKSSLHVNNSVPISSGSIVVDQGTTIAIQCLGQNARVIETVLPSISLPINIMSSSIPQVQSANMSCAVIPNHVKVIQSDIRNTLPTPITILSTNQRQMSVLNDPANVPSMTSIPDTASAVPSAMSQDMRGLNSGINSMPGSVS